MSEVILFGEPMALFTANSEGNLEDVEKFSRSLAGAEVNVCIGLKRLGHSVSYITKLGNEPLGVYVKKYLEREGIDTEFVSIDKHNTTGIMFKSKVSKGDPATAYYRKSSAFSHMGIKDIEKIDFSDVKLVHVTGIPPALSKECRDATYRLMEKAKENNVYITFDPNLRPALWEDKEVMVKVINDLASKADMVLPGLSEALILTGSNDLDKITKFYKNLGVKNIVIKSGSKGAYVIEGEKQYFKKGFKVDKVVDTVGAGDGFAVGIISGILEGMTLEDSVVRGNLIGAIQVRSISDNEALPTREELEDYSKKMTLVNDNIE